MKLKGAKKTKALALIAFLLPQMVFALIQIAPARAVAPSRALPIYVLQASDSPSSWIGSTSDVVTGINAAMSDAHTNAKVQYGSGDTINVNTLASTTDLSNLVSSPPLGVVIMNTHGEVIPMPNAYFGPSISIALPADGGSYTSFPSITAWVWPSPGSQLQMSTFCCTPDYVLYSLVWSRVTGPSGYDSKWIMMSGPDYSGGYYQTTGLNPPYYGTYTIYVGAYANGYWTNAYVTINYNAPPPPTGGGGCPFVSAWNGSKYNLDNNLLPYSKLSNGSDVVDYYKIQQPLASDANGNYPLLIREFQQEHSYMDQSQLLTVDHSPSVNVAVSPYGEILSYTNPSPPVSAIDNNGVNVKQLLSSIDGAYYQAQNGSFITINFGDLDVSHGSRLVMQADMAYKMSIHVQVQDATGRWGDVAVDIPRINWATEIIDMSRYLPDARGNLKVRLYFTANHKLDFVGLDTSTQSALKIQAAPLVSAIHMADGLQPVGGLLSDATTYQNLLYSDGLRAELTPGYQFNLKFASPSNVASGNVRDFVLVTKGFYKSAIDPAVAVFAGWRDWFNLLANRMRQYGWIWANVAGYSAYYFGNSWYTSQFSNYNMWLDQQQPHVAGLQQVLARNIESNYPSGDKAQRGFDISNNPGFLNTYTRLPLSVMVGRTFTSSVVLPWDALGYYDTTDGSYVTGAITMNATIANTRTYAGIFIHNGLLADVDNDGVVSSQDDWTKGYIATAMAIEEARANLVQPVVQTETQGNQHAGVFSVSMRPGGSYEGYYTNGTHYYAVKLIAAAGGQFKNYLETGLGYAILYYLSDVDYSFSSASSPHSYFDLADYLSESGIDTGNKNTQLMNDLYWWEIGTMTGAIPVVGTFLGAGVGLIPIISNYVMPPDHNYLGSSAWVNKLDINYQSQQHGTAALYLEVRFNGIEGQGPTTYTFNVNMKSWIAYSSDSTIEEYRNVATTFQLSFTVFW